MEVEFKYEHPWRLGITWAFVLLTAAGIAKIVLLLVPGSIQTRLMWGCIGAGIAANLVRGILEPRLAKRRAFLRCRLCERTSTPR